MKNFLRMTLLAVTVAGASFSTLAATTSNVPAPAQDPIVQHLKLSTDQIAQIKKLHQQLETNVSQISVKDVKDGALGSGMKQPSKNSFRHSATSNSRRVIIA